MKSEGSKFTMFAAAACLFTLGLTGCNLRGQSSVEPPGAPAAAAVSATPTAEPPSAAEPSSTPAPAPSFEAVTYRDATNGFELDHPASWVVGPTQQQSRGGITAFTSWDRPIDEPPGMTPPGETRMDVTVQLWDPARGRAPLRRPPRTPRGAPAANRPRAPPAPPTPARAASQAPPPPPAAGAGRARGGGGGGARRPG